MATKRVDLKHSGTEVAITAGTCRDNKKMYLIPLKYWGGLAVLLDDIRKKRLGCGPFDLGRCIHYPELEGVFFIPDFVEVRRGSGYWRKFFNDVSSKRFAVSHEPRGK